MYPDPVITDWNNIPMMIRSQYLQPMQTLESLLKFTEQSVYDVTGEYLNDLQRVILREASQDPKKTYEEIAIEHKYSGNYIQQIVAPRLWRLLSKVLGQKVTKSNLRSVLERCRDAHNTAIQEPSASNLDRTAIAIISPLDDPTCSVPLKSPFYVPRSSQELLCYQVIHQPNALIRIHGPRQIGKTSFLWRILAYAQATNLQTVVLNFQQAEKSILADLNKLLRWFCTCITQKLKLPPQLSIYWDDDMGSKTSCTLYMQEYLLKGLAAPVVLALEEISDLFEYPAIAEDFFSLLRTWQEQAKTDECWQQLRLILVQSTEPYIHLDRYQLPLNMGLEVVLPPFTTDQVDSLIDCHGLNFLAHKFSN